MDRGRTAVSLGELIESAPEGAAVHAGGATITRDELIARADSLASRLGSAGVEPGNVVAVMLPNGPDAVAALFGVWRAAAVHAPFNPRAAGDEIVAASSAVQPTAVVTTEEHVGRFGDEVGVVVAGPDGWVIRRASTRTAARRDDRVALIQFTSGTTGRPKPVPLRHDTVLDLLDRVLGTLRGRGNRKATDRPPMPNLIPVSLSLWAGIYQVLFAFRVGAPVVLMERFDASEFATLVRRFDIRSTVLPPAALVMLADDESIDDLSPLRMVRSISAPLSPAQARRFRDRFGVLVMNSYGQTELGGEVVGWSAADVREHGEQKLGSVGRPHAGVEVRVAEVEGEPLAPREVGELQVRTPATAGGGVGPDFAERLTVDGWFRTGDIGHIDVDGFVWVEGRVSDMVNRGGLKVFPAQVEEVLLAAPGVRDAAVVGIPDDRLGEVPWAFVVLSAGHHDVERLVGWCRARLSPYKVPVRVVAVDALPRNEVGKVLKRDLAARARSET
jgi:acyl-CoA synthetase (AMP-forming)/AMP-acid ligase II